MVFFLLLVSGAVLMVLGIVKLGSIAFQLTGMEPKMATFQALSAFTNTGFTTRASEKVVQNRPRRVIATVLITLGYIGIVGIIVTLSRSFAADTGTWFPHLTRLVCSLAGLYIVYFLWRLSPLGRKLRERFDRYCEKQRELQLDDLS